MFPELNFLQYLLNNYFLMIFFLMEYNFLLVAACHVFWILRLGLCSLDLKSSVWSFTQVLIGSTAQFTSGKITIGGILVTLMLMKAKSWFY